MTKEQAATIVAAIRTIADVKVRTMPTDDALVVLSQTAVNQKQATEAMMMCLMTALECTGAEPSLVLAKSIMRFAELLALLSKDPISTGDALRKVAQLSDSADEQVNKLRKLVELASIGPGNSGGKPGAN